VGREGTCRALTSVSLVLPVRFRERAAIDVVSSRVTVERRFFGNGRGVRRHRWQLAFLPGRNFP